MRCGFDPAKRSIRPARATSMFEERAEHLQQVLGAVLDYVGAIVADTSQVAPGGSVDRKYLQGLISGLAGDVGGSIANAADDLAARRVW
jgi:hypothetical protein